ncbi:MAG: hypothetical protein LDL41_19180, partial [Coleofasciculus sp. S288]|nr:hypothetical protein [Coleofasciculus sp. S288]
MVKPTAENNTHSQTYQQALDDFGIAELLLHLSNYADDDFKAQWMNLEEQELKSLAAVLIEHLTHNLKGKLIGSYLNAIRHGNSDVRSRPLNREIPSPSMELPANFPDTAKPRYQEGDRVRWRCVGNHTDWGVVMGRFYSYAQHQCQWAVRYLIRLDPNSPSAAWVVEDTAWEEDLEPITDSDWKSLGDGERPLPSLEINQQLNAPRPGQLPAEPNDSATFSLSTAYLQTALDTSGNALAMIQKLLRVPPAPYNSGGDRRNPRPLTQREQNLIALYSHCQLAMTPMRFYSKWEVSYEQIALICSRSTVTVQRWFSI